jgi:site-specific recombinase XerD
VILGRRNVTTETHTCGGFLRRNGMGRDGHGLDLSRYAHLHDCERARVWLRIQQNLGLAANTLHAYGRALNDFLEFLARDGAQAETASKENVAAWVRDLLRRPNTRSRKLVVIDSGAGLANATLQQRITAVRLFFDYLIEEEVRSSNPVGRGRYTPRTRFATKGERGILPRFRRLPWIPNDDEWRSVIEAAKAEPLRNRLMLALSYDSALRREELCGLATGDFDPAHRTITVRAETTKNRRSRVVPFSAATGELLALYIRTRRGISSSRGSLFLSESRRNRAAPVSIWTWSKAVKRISSRAGVERFTTHTCRHLRLTDLARADWDIHEIAKFAGHKSIETTLLYIHLSGRDLAKKLASGMFQIHNWRIETLKEALLE